jgi:hypothetical protein
MKKKLTDACLAQENGFFALHVLLRLLAEAGKKALQSLWHLLEKSVINTD